MKSKSIVPIHIIIISCLVTVLFMFGFMTFIAAKQDMNQGILDVSAATLIFSITTILSLGLAMVIINLREDWIYQMNTEFTFIPKSHPIVMVLCPNESRAIRPDVIDKLSLEGNIVIHDSDAECEVLLLDEDFRDTLENLHESKIRLADMIYVVNLIDPISDEIQADIKLAIHLGKQIEYLR